MNTSLTIESSNGKTGPIAVTTTDRRSCPSTCPLAGDGGCYAQSGYYTRLHWDAVTDGRRGMSANALIDAVSMLEEWRMLRHNVAGDLWHFDGEINASLLRRFALAASHLRAAWTYTHHVLTEYNVWAIRRAIKAGLTVNASCESVTVAASVAKSGMPTVCIVPQDAPAVFREDGVLFRQCPATFDGSPTQCASCGGGRPLCSIANRDFVITFPVHGAKAKEAVKSCS